MLLRLSLGIAILAGAVALYWSHVQVGGKIQGLESDLSQAQQDAQIARQQASQARQEREEAVERANELQTELTDTQSQLEAKTAEATQQRSRADDLEQRLETVTRERNEAQRELAQWQALGIPVTQIRNRLGQLVKVEEQRDVYAQENQLLEREIAALENELKQYIGVKEPEVELPDGLSGEVIAVDPKWNFVVINIGSEQGVLKYGKMSVHRDGKLISKVRIVDVESDRSIANIMNDWTQADVMEGDKVVYFQ